MSDTIRTPPTLEDLRARRDEILALMDKYGASNVRVFGSVARGEAGPESDVDLLVKFPSNKSMFELVGLWLDVQELLGCDVSLITDHSDDALFMQSVLEDAIPL
ncbi:MAG: nucleotidyltransferase family protein [Anaerolineae bacterium]|nr:nucleotidyltransferase family protein [Anaerolineae bacterium]